MKCKNRVTVREERKEKSAVAAAAVSRGCYSLQQQQQQQQQHNNSDVITTQTRACSKQPESTVLVGRTMTWLNRLKSNVRSFPFVNAIPENFILALFFLIHHSINAFNKIKVKKFTIRLISVYWTDYFKALTERAQVTNESRQHQLAYSLTHCQAAAREREREILL